MLGALYDAYGRRYTWEARHRAMLEMYRPLFDLTLQAGVPEEQRRGATRMFERIEAFEELL